MRNRELERCLGIRPGRKRLASGGQNDPADHHIHHAAKNLEQSHHAKRQRKPSSEDFDEGTVTFDEVAGLDHIKTEIRRRMVLPYAEEKPL